jgi:hypothetical protein
MQPQADSTFHAKHSKRCSGCRETKPVGDFNRGCRSFGRSNYCRLCSRAATKRAMSRRRSSADYRAGELAQDNRRYRDDVGFRQRAIARSRANKALKRGELTRLPCAVCSDPKAEMHHRDYSKPLEIEWLCKKHHLAHHYPLAGSDSGREA